MAFVRKIAPPPLQFRIECKFGAVYSNPAMKITQPIIPVWFGYRNIYMRPSFGEGRTPAPFLNCMYPNSTTHLRLY